MRRCVMRVKGGISMSGSEDALSRLKKMLADSSRIVFFGGAGVSTESGIPDFRSASGIYRENFGALSPERIVSHSFFMAHPDLFYAFYKSKMLYPDAKPGGAHYALAKLEAAGKLTCVITQNIDGLHQAAGSKRVFELHGSAHRNTCISCGAKYELSYIAESTGVPRCSRCGGIIKPDVTLFDEALPEDAFRAAEAAVRHADMLIVGGTSLSVFPASSLIYHFQGDRLVMINYEPTAADTLAALVIHDAVGKVLEAVV